MERKPFSCKSFSDVGIDGPKRGLGFFRKHCEKKKKRDLFKDNGENLFNNGG